MLCVLVRLGNVHINVDSISENWAGLKRAEYHIEKRSGSWRAYAVRAAATVFDRSKDMHGVLIVSAELLGRSEGLSGKVYTLSPGHWSTSFSALIGKLANTKGHDDEGVERFE